MPHARPAAGSAAATLEAPEGQLVVDEDSGSSFVAGAGQTLLDAALEQGVALPYGCRVGSCGACAVEIVRGVEHLDVPDAIEADALGRFGLPSCQRLACRATTRGPLRLRPLD